MDITEATNNTQYAAASVPAHAEDATPAVIDPSLTDVLVIADRLLSLRGSPVGTHASLSEHEIRSLCSRARPISCSNPCY